MTNRRLGIAMCSLAALLVAAGLANATAYASDELSYPDTIAGRRVAAFFKAFNAGEDAMRVYEGEHRAKSALEKRSIDDRLGLYRDLRSRWGRLDARKLIESTDTQIAVLVKPTLLDEWLRFGFELEQESPHGLVAIAIEGPVDPKAVEAAAGMLDTDMRREIIDAVSEALKTMYVFPDKAEAMAAALHKHVEGGDYDEINSAGVFARRLTNDLQAVCHDKHLRVGVRGSGGDPVASWRRRGENRANNYGFQKVEVLPGNVGYVKLNNFHPSTEAQETAAAAMTLLRNCDVLVFDLRSNGGGSPEMIKFLSGYLFDKRVHLNSFYYRISDETTHTYSRTDVPGTKFGEKLPVYVLTSHYTFSGAEEFTYNLKHLKRATIVGETTGGGAHPVRPQQLPHGFSMSVPHGRAINPITKTNWEGVGVKPHIDVPAAKALDAALEHARAAIAKHKGA